MSLILHGMKLAEKKYRCTFEEAKKAVNYGGRRAMVKVHGYSQSMYVGRSVGLRKESDDTIYLLIDDKDRADDVNTLFALLDEKPNNRLQVPDKSTIGLDVKRNKAGSPMYTFIINFPRKIATKPSDAI